MLVYTIACTTVVNPRAHAQRRVIQCSRSVCPQVFSRTMAAVDTKRGYVGMCNGRSAQQESGTS